MVLIIFMLIELFNNQLNAFEGCMYLQVIHSHTCKKSNNELVRLVTFISIVCFFQMCSKSLEAAKHIEKLIATNPESASSFKEGVLVGGMLSSKLHLSEEDIDLIMSDPSLPSVLPDMVFSFPKFVETRSNTPRHALQKRRTCGFAG